MVGRSYCTSDTFGICVFKCLNRTVETAENRRVSTMRPVGRRDFLRTQKVVCTVAPHNDSSTGNLSKRFSESLEITSSACICGFITPINVICKVDKSCSCPHFVCKRAFENSRTIFPICVKLNILIRIAPRNHSCFGKETDADGIYTALARTGIVDSGGIICRWKTFISIRIHSNGEGKLLHIADTVRCFCGNACFIQCREQHCREDGDDRYRKMEKNSYLLQSYRLKQTSYEINKFCN